MRARVGELLVLVAVMAAGRAWAGGTTERASVGSGGRQAFADSFASGQATISADGRYVVFGSRASRLVAGDTNQNSTCSSATAGSAHRAGQRRPGGTQATEQRRLPGDLGGRPLRRLLLEGLEPRAERHEPPVGHLPHDRRDGTNLRVDVGPGGAQVDNTDVVDRLSLSEDGRLVAFSSRAAGLVAGDTNGDWDVFVRDTRAGRTERVSVASDGGQATGTASAPRSRPTGATSPSLRRHQPGAGRHQRPGPTCSSTTACRARRSG